MAGHKHVIYLDNKASLSQITERGSHDLSLREQVSPKDKITRDKTIVWVASERINFNQIQLATRKASVLYKTLPFALEEKIANEPEENHYAFYKTPLDQPLPLALVEHSLMQDWQTALGLHSIHTELMLPDIFAVPLYSDAEMQEVFETTQNTEQTDATREEAITQWSLWYEADRCVVRTDRYEGFACALDWFKDLLNVYRQKSQVKLLVWTPEPDGIKQDWPEILKDADARIIYTNCPFYQHLIKQTARNKSAINLLQNTYAQQSKWLKHLYAWKQEAALVATLLICVLLLGITNLYQTYQATEHLEQATQKLYFTLFPESKRVRNLKAQTQANINNLSQKSGRNDQSMWPVFAQVSSLLQTCRNCIVKNISMTTNRLNITIQQTQLQNKLIVQLEKIEGIKLRWNIKEEQRVKPADPIKRTTEEQPATNYMLTLDIRKLL